MFSDAKPVVLRITILLILCAAPLSVVAQRGTPPCEVGTATAYLDANNVRAQLHNTGGLFWRTGDPVYTIPKYGQANALFTTGIWLSGKVNGEMRVSRARYSGYEFVPGPLDPNGNPPEDCAPYDHIYVVSESDIAAFNQSGIATEDMRKWPLGAPVEDGDGNSSNYDLSAGDRPGIPGEQVAWWVMNDAGPQVIGDTPIGVEVQVTAFAYDRDILKNVTFYKYEVVYEGEGPLQDAYFSIWTDADLGNGEDDFVGSDTTLHLGYVYNGDSLDETSNGYGTAPPALGITFLQGALRIDDALDNDKDGEIDEDNERLGMETFITTDAGYGIIGGPNSLEEYYHYARGRWRNGEAMTVGGVGIGGSEETRIIYPGDAAQQEYWSEEDFSAETGIQRHAPSDRKFVMSTGPFDMQPGEKQSFVFAIVWSRAEDRLASVLSLKNDVQVVRRIFSDYIRPTLNKYVPNQGKNPPDIPEAFVLKHIAPNPFRSRTRFVFDMSAPADVTLKVFNVLGQQVREIVRPSLTPGEQSITLQGEELAAGVYYFRFTAQSEQHQVWRTSGSLVHL